MKSPFNAKQEEFLKASDKRINILSGSVRSGKTWISLLKWAFFIGGMPGHYEFIMCGKTLTALKRNCLNLLMELIGGNNFTFSIAQKSGWLFGRRVWLEGANDERSEAKIRGMTLGGAYCDELTLFPQGFFNMLLSRLSLPGAKLYATTNPDAPTHWVKTDVIDNKGINVALWHFLLTDNKFLDPVWLEEIQREYTGVFYDRYILGLWKRAEGSIYRVFIENESDFYKIQHNKNSGFIIDGAQHTLDFINIGLDWGGNSSGHAFAATGITKNYGHVIIQRSEWHPAQGTTPDDVCRLTLAFIEKVRERYGKIDDIYADSSEQLMINLIRGKADVPVRNSIKRLIIDRIRFTVALMAQRRLFLMDGCESVANFFHTAVYDPKALEDKRLDDGSYDQDSGDAWEYSVERFMNYIIRE